MMDNPICIYCGEELTQEDKKWSFAYICPNCAGVMNEDELGEKGDEYLLSLRA